METKKWKKIVDLIILGMLYLLSFLAIKEAIRMETIPSYTQQEIVEPVNTIASEASSIVETYVAITPSPVMSDEELIWTTLNEGFNGNDIATAAVMGNMKEESRLCPYRFENDMEDGFSVSAYRNEQFKKSKSTFIYEWGGYGLVGWTACGRKENLWNFAEEKGTEIDDILTQCEFCIYEFNNRYTSTLTHITTTDDLYWATEVVRNEYEKAVKDPQSLYRRQLYAKEFYNKYGEEK